MRSYCIPEKCFGLPIPHIAPLQEEWGSEWPHFLTSSLKSSSTEALLLGTMEVTHEPFCMMSFPRADFSTYWFFLSSFMPLNPLTPREISIQTLWPCPFSLDEGSSTLDNIRLASYSSCPGPSLSRLASSQIEEQAHDSQMTGTRSHHRSGHDCQVFPDLWSNALKGRKLFKGGGRVAGRRGQRGRRAGGAGGGGEQEECWGVTRVPHTQLHSSLSRQLL